VASSSNPAKPLSAGCCSSFRTFAGIYNGTLNVSTAAFTTAFSNSILMDISASLIRFCATVAKHLNYAGAAFRSLRLAGGFIGSLGPSRLTTCAPSVAATSRQSTLNQG
jgi:hypothetical protein